MKLFLLLGLSVLTIAHAGNIIRIPLKKIQSRDPNYCKNVCNVPYHDSYKTFFTKYFAEIAIGTPEQHFNVLVDTAAGYSWVISQDCNTPECIRHVRYDRLSSSTHRSNGTRFTENDKEDGLYYIQAVEFTDTVKIGQKTINKQIFGEAEYIRGNFLDTYLDGVFSLNYETWMVRRFFQTLISHDLIEHNVFSVYLNRDKYSSDGGELILGGVDDNKYPSTFTNVPVTEDGYRWIISIDKIYVDKDTMFSKASAVVDTSVTGIFGPEEQIKQINQILNATQDCCGDYVVDCNSINSLPLISFEFRGTKFPFKGEDYVFIVLQNNGRKKCVSLFRNTLWTDQNWVLGDLFIAKYYTKFNLEKKEISFATDAGYTRSASYLLILINIFALFNTIIENEQ